MQFTNGTRLAASFTQGLQPDARELVVVVAKGTFEFPRPGAAPTLAVEQLPLVDADTFTGEPGFSAPRDECDFAPFKPRCDVLLHGSAYAPRGIPAERVTVGLSVGPIAKSFDVVGPRAWIKGLMGTGVSRPVPFTKQRISYDVAFGGADRTADPPQFYPLNHAGAGFAANLDEINGRPLPNTEERGSEVTSPRGRYRPMAFGPVGRSWQPRAPLAGTYDQAWLDNVFPFLPRDFKPEYYQAAPADQQMAYPRGGETITLLNLTPEGATSLTVPSMDVPVTFYLRDAEPVERQAVIDTIVIEPDLKRFTVTWRTAQPLKRNVFEVSHILVGRMSRGWHLARELGKRYAASIADAIHPIFRGQPVPAEGEP